MKKIYIIQGFGCFRTDPDFLDIKQTEFPVKLVVQYNTIMDITMQCAMCWYIPITLLFQIPIVGILAYLHRALRHVGQTIVLLIILTGKILVI